jgi:MFS family permease
VIRRNPAYRIFLVATLLSFTGSTVHVIAASWLILELTGAGYAVPLLLLFSVVPGVVLSPVVGWLVDRVDARAVLVVVDLVSGLAVLAVPVLAWAGSLRAWHLYGVETMVAVAGQFYGPASRVFVWRLAPRQELLAANATVTLVYQSGIALGALGGGFLVATVGPLAGLLANAASFGISAIGMLLIRANNRWTAGGAVNGPDEPDGPVVHHGMWRGLVGTARLVADQPRIWHMTALYLGLQSTHRLLAGLLVPFVAAAGLGAGTQGALQMCYSVGAVLAGAMVPALARRLGELPLLLLGSVGVAGLVVAFSVAADRWLALAVYGGIGLAVSSWVYPLTAAQELVPGDAQGRYHAMVGALVSVAGVAVFATSSVLLRFLEPRTVYWLGAVALLAAALPSVLRTNRREVDAYRVRPAGRP